MNRQAGSNIILAARREDALHKVAAACKVAHSESGSQEGGKYCTVKMDVSNRSEVKNFMNDVPPELRNVDILGANTLVSEIVQLTYIG